MTAPWTLAARTPTWVYAISLIPALAVIGAVAAQPWVPADYLFKDPLEVAELVGSDCCHLYFGFVSQLGVLVWWMAASVCLFAGLALLQRKADRRQVLFLLCASALTALLTADDFFHGHEIVARKLFGVGEEPVYAVYVALVAIYLACFRHQFMKVDSAVLLLSLLFLTATLLIDLFVPKGGELHRFSEDGSKLLGISTWTTFHIRAAWLLMMRGEGP